MDVRRFLAAGVRTVCIGNPLCSGKGHGRSEWLLFGFWTV
jgi:hypothetical protein